MPNEDKAVTEAKAEIEALERIIGFGSADGLLATVRRVCKERDALQSKLALADALRDAAESLLDHIVGQSAHGQPRMKLRAAVAAYDEAGKGGTP